MKQSHVYFLAFSLVGILGCSQSIDQSVLIGKYTASHENGEEIINLKPDGSYVHYYQASDGTESTITNKWEFENRDGDPILVLYQFTTHFPDYFPPLPYSIDKKPGISVIHIDNWFGRKITLWINRDVNYYYEKNPS